MSAQTVSRSITYRERLAEAAGLGFISSRRRSAIRRLMEGVLALGFRRPELRHPSDGNVCLVAWYGAFRISRCFSLNADGSLPDQLALAGMRKIAERLDAKRRPSASNKRSARRVSAPREPALLNHPIYVWHNNEQPKLEELVAAMPPVGGMASYIADLTLSAANDTGPIHEAA